MRVIAIVLIMAVVVLLVAAMAGGPLLAMRNRAEADEPTTGSGQSSGEPDAGRTRPGHPRSHSDPSDNVMTATSPTEQRIDRMNPGRGVFGHG